VSMASTGPVSTSSSTRSTGRTAWTSTGPCRPISTWWPSWAAVCGRSPSPGWIPRSQRRARKGIDAYVHLPNFLVVAAEL
jgi:hypothetical protein